MIAFSACIGTGLFLQSGKVVFLAGPGLAVVAYLLSGSIIWSVMSSLGEMTALFPIQGGIFVFPTRFLDEGVGYAVGWMTWYLLQAEFPFRSRTNLLSGFPGWSYLQPKCWL